MNANNYNEYNYCVIYVRTLIYADVTFITTSIYRRSSRLNTITFTSDGKLPAKVARRLL